MLQYHAGLTLERKHIIFCSFPPLAGTVCTELIQSTFVNLLLFSRCLLPYLPSLKLFLLFYSTCTIFKWLYSSSSLFSLISCSNLLPRVAFCSVSLSLLVSKLCQDLLLPLRCSSAHSAKRTCYYVGISQTWREGLHCATDKVEPWTNKSSSILLPFRDQFILLQPAAELKEWSLKPTGRHGGIWSLYA